MTYLVIERSNNWNSLGEAINEKKVEVLRSDTLGFALAFVEKNSTRHTWGQALTVHLDVVDLSGRKYFLDDLWEQMLSPEAFAAELAPTAKLLAEVFG